MALDIVELLDIVNAQDEVIGQECRSTFHTSDLKKNGGLLRFTHIFLRNDEGQVLIQQRSASKPAHPNLLDLSAAGHVTAGDSYENAAYREMREEIGVETPVTHLFKRRVPSGFANVYEGHWNGDIIPCPIEVKGTYWHTIEEVQTLFILAPHLFASGLRESWPDYYTYITTGNKPDIF